MVASAAGDDQDAVHARQHFRRRSAEKVGRDRLRSPYHLHRVGQGLRLFEDFLLHVVAVLAQFHRIRRERAFVAGAHDRCAVGAHDAEAMPGDFGDVAILEIDHRPRHLQQCRSIGGGIAAIRCAAQEQRRAALCGDYPLLALPQHADGIGADQFRGSTAYRFEQVRHGLQGVIEQMRDGLGVGIRDEDVAQSGKHPPQFGIVLDDAVMNHRQPPRDMRMGIALRRHTMGGPARVGDAGTCREALYLGGKLGHPAVAAQAYQARIEQRQSGRIVAAVFQFFQTLDEDGNNVAISNRRDDAAHEQTPLSVHF